LPIANKLFYYDHEGALVCLAADTGELAWKTHLRSLAQGAPPRYGCAASALAVGDLIVVPVYSEKGALAAVRMDNGEMAWIGGYIGSHGNGERRWDGYSTPVAIEADETLIHYTGNGIQKIDSSTGRLIWKYPIRHSTGEAIQMPIVCDSSVFVSSVYSNMALMLDVAGLSPRAVWQNKSKPLAV